MEQSDSSKFNPVNFYLGLSGRINRKQFWPYGYIPLLVASSVVAVLTQSILLAALFGSGSIESAFLTVAIAFCVLFALFVVMLWVGLAIQIKRWHDRDKPAWWIFIGLIPIAGPIWALIELGFLREPRRRTDTAQCHSHIENRTETAFGISLPLMLTAAPSPTHTATATPTPARDSADAGADIVLSSDELGTKLP